MTDVPSHSNRSQNRQIHPTAIRIEACSMCQLRCAMCQAIGNQRDLVGRGALAFDDFRDMVCRNPWIKKVELGNWGEVFLNKDIPRILQYAHEKEIVTEIDEGVNLNDVSDEALDAVVRFGVQKIRCAVDGISQDVYAKYRVGGSLKKVIKNIKKINTLKEHYGSPTPRLIFQFVIFGHNAHQAERAALLARMLNMDIEFKLDCLISKGSLEILKTARRLTGYADREDYLKREKRHYMRHLCYDLWRRPQVNWDGKLLGCTRNIWKVFADNVFEGKLLDHFNNEKMTYARSMLMKRSAPREDMPCLHCAVFASMLQYDHWITEDELAGIEDMN